MNIRGQRVDLAGVDHALRKDPKVLDAVTVIQHDSQRAAFLVSFVVPAMQAVSRDDGVRLGVAQSSTGVLADVGDAVEFETGLKHSVSSVLPSFMIPSFIVPLPALPHTINGKIDRKRLTSWSHLVDYARDGDASTTVGGHDSTSPAEDIIVEIFKEILRRKQVRADHSFFHLGGHSLLATQVISRVRKALGVDDRLTVRALFDAPTAHSLAQVVDSLCYQDSETSGPVSHIASGYQLISRVQARDTYILSYAQERLYFLELLHPGQTGYIIPHVLHISGELNIPALGAAFRDLCERHEMLRVTYEEVNGIVTQRIHNVLEDELHVVDLACEAQPELLVQEKVRFDNNASFDLHHDLPIRFKLYRLAPDTHVLWMALHHLSTDAWSDRVIQRELGLSYSAHRKGVSAMLPDLPVTYMDYAAWQREPDQSARQAEQLKYWVDTLQGSIPVEFPTDFARPSTLSARAGVEHIDIIGEEAMALEQFAASMNSTPFIVLLSVLRTLHYRLTGVEDATIGSPIANRNRMELEGMVGFFVNTQCMRIPLEGGTTFRRLCEDVRSTAAAAYEAQDVAFERIVHELQPARDLSRNPIVQVMIAVHPEEDTHLGDDEGNLLEVKTVDVDPVTRFDLELHFVKTRNGEGYGGRLLYSRDLYNQESAARLTTQLRTILRQAIGVEGNHINADLRLDEFMLPNAVESLERFGLLKDTTYPFPGDQGLGDLFRESVRMNGDRVAVKDAYRSVSYKELDAMSDLVAHHLLALGLPAETLVGLFCVRSVHYIACILGILKAGLAYLPLDPQLPHDRIVTLLSDIPQRSPVYCDASVQDLNRRDVVHNFVDVESVLAESYDPKRTTQLAGRATGRSLAYAMYTSGSTGKPKAVLIEQRSIARLAFSMSVVEPRPGQVWAHISNTAFDSSTWEIWTPLLNGGTVVCFDRMTVLDFHLLRSAFETHGVDIAFLTTALAAKCLHETPSLIAGLEVLATGGERCDSRDLTAMSELIRGYVAHVYGPTESTTYATVYRLSRGESFKDAVPIGRPLSNTTAYILDSKRRLLPVGVVGDLYLGGDGLARGYGDDEQTRRAFDSVKLFDVELRLYRTGDKARWRTSDGHIEFMGRSDNQIKLRGQRIELGEIEYAIRQNPVVQSAAVVLHEQDGLEKSIAAFIVPRSSEEASQLTEGDKVEGWAQIFDDETYSKVEDVSISDVGRDFVGWTSMLDGNEIPHSEMHEWLEDTVRTIVESGEVGNVVEIGTGSGMILFNLQDHFKTYIGVDPSSTAVRFVNRALRGKAHLVDRVDVRVGTATDISKFGHIQPDLFIINSVAQYFPSGEYLANTIRAAIDLCGGRPSRMFLGDIRSLALSDTFFLSYAAHQLRSEGAPLSPDRLVHRARILFESHTELLVHPAFFFDLQRACKSISHVEILPKRMVAKNELSQYRYQVLLHFNDFASQLIELDDAQWRDMAGLDWTADALRTEIASLSPHNVIALKNIPNALLSEERELAEHRGAIGPDCTHWTFAMMHALAEELGVRIQCSWAAHDGRGTFDVVLAGSQARTGLYRFPEPHPSMRQTTNDPANAILKQSVDLADLKEYLRSKLPGYMIPSHIEVLRQLPVTANGKIDRRGLLVMLSQRTAPHMQVDYAEPTTEMERRIVSVFEDVLGVDGISVDASFFDIGGHSLLATKVVSRLRRMLDVQVGVRDLFNAPSARRLGEELESRDASATMIHVPIPKLVHDEFAPLSASQARLVFLDELNPGNHWWHINIALRIHGKLDTDALECALNDLRLRHETLRSIFPTIDGSSAVKVLDFVALKLPRTSFSRLASPEIALRDTLRAESTKGFHLASDVPFRCHLFDMGDDEHVLSLTLHHIVYDGYSLDIIKRELSHFYACATTGKPPSLPPLAIQYRDYAAWQQHPMQQEKQQRQIDFWRRELSGSVPAEFPTDYARPQVLQHAAGLQKFPLDIKTSARIDHICQKLGVTPFMALLAVFKSLHYRMTGVPDALIGTLNGNRSREEIEGLVGFFVDTQALRIPIDDDTSFADLVLTTREVVTKAFEHEDVSFDKVVSALHPARDLSRNPVVQVIFAVHSFNYDSWDVLSGLKTVATDPQPTTRMDLELHIYKRANDSTYEGHLLFNSGLYSESWARNFASTFTDLVCGAMNDIDLSIGTLAFSKASQDLFDHGLLSINSTDYPQDKTVVDLFAESVAHDPSHVAVIDATGKHSYRDIDETSEKIADALMSCLPSPAAETTVGIFVHRSALNVAAMYGVLKAGLAYVPLDPALPVARLRDLLEDHNGPRILLHCTSQLLPDLRVDDCVVLNIDDILKSTPPDTMTMIESSLNNVGRQARLPISPRSLAYIMYTSGSTGRPKGVMVEHRGIVRLVRKTNITDIQPGQRVAHLSALSFDASTFEIFSTLSNGGIIVTLDQMTLLDPEALTTFAESHRIQIAYMTAALFAQFVRSAPRFLRQLDLVITGGDIVEVRDVVEAYKLGVKRIIDAFGPTEDTVWSTFYEIPPAKADFPRSIPVGKSISNSRAFVVDTNRRLVPMGVVGELVLGGDGVARGYTDPELTARSFVTMDVAGRSERVYKTGDRARISPLDGNIEFLGRMDNQVKLRGQRIELGEIEHALHRHKAVVDACVILHTGGDGEKQIVAFVIARKTISATSPSQLRRHVASLLPAYMVPTSVQLIDRFPLTTATKVDRKALSRAYEEGPGRAEQEPDDDAFESPEGWIEETVAEVFRSVLNVSSVGANDDFFELGGHSLMAVRVALTVSESVGVHVSVRDMYEASTPRGLASRIERTMRQAPSTTSAKAGPCTTRIKKADGGPTMYMVHDVFGLATPYRALAPHLDVNLVGFNDPYFGRDGFKTLSAMADHYAAQIAPCEAGIIVMGWSFGGTVAAEVVARLEDCGIRASLVLVDAARVDTFTAARTDIDAFIKGQGHPAALEECLLHEVHKNVEILRAHTSSRRLGGGTRITSVKAMKHPDERERDLTPEDGELFDERNGWGTMLGDDWTTVKISASHFELFNQPNVEEMARILEEAMRM